MSRMIKGMVIDDLRRRLAGVEAAVVVNVIGLDSEKSFTIRKKLREKNMNLLVVKSSLAQKACEGTPLARLFDGVSGSCAILWGGEDFVSLVKDAVKLDKGAEFEQFKAKGAVLDGEAISGEKLKEVAKWPNRAEQLSILSGQILAPGARLLGAILAPGGALASQIEKKSEGGEEPASEPPAEPAAGA